ncbi:MAG: 7TM-DISM domain-containing protein [Pseudomonadota bacterium]
MWRPLACLLILLLLVASGRVWAGVRITEQAWLDDPSGSLTLAQVQNRHVDFRPYAGILNQGYSAGTRWIRLRVEPDASPAAGGEPRWVLRIRTALLDDVALFDPLAADPDTGAIRPAYTGDRHAWRNGSYRALDLGFAIPASTQPRELWLRVRSTSAHTIHIEALTESQAAQSARSRELLHSLFLGLMAMFVVWAALQAALYRERLLGLFALNQAAVFFYAASFFGYWRVLLDGRLPPAAIDRLSSWCVLLLVGTSFGFHLLLLRDFRPRRALWRLATLALLAWVAAAAALAAGRAGQALQINMVIGAIFPLLMLALALSTRAWHDWRGREAEPPLLSRQVLIGFYAAIAASAQLATLPFLGLVQNATLALNMPVITGVLSAALMLALLTLRGRQQQRRHLATVLSLQQERERREEREQFLAMLTHELKAPLGVARLTLDSLGIAGPEGQRIRRSLVSIDDIIERCRLSERLEGAHLQPAVEPCEVAEAVASCIKACAEPARVRLQQEHAGLVRSDRQLLEIIVANLLDNALKYSPPDSPVDVTVAPCTQRGRAGVDVHVASLLGIAGRPDPARVFDKYYRSPGAARASGSGLGLYLSRGIARLIGGRLHLLAPQGDEVVFRLWLPR